MKPELPFTHRQLTVGAYQVNCHLLICRETREAVLIDPGDEAQRILEMISEEPEGLTLKKILLTHAHLDHIGAVNEIRNKLKVPVFLHPEDVPLAMGARDQAAVLGLAPHGFEPVGETVDLKAQSTTSFGKVELAVLHTPGHSPGSVSFYFSGKPLENAGVVFSGDALFAGSVGRTDLWRGDMAVLIQGIKKRLLTLPGTTVVYPGHGPKTTIEWEMKRNPFLE